jgi:hypothetical protein
MPNGFPPASLTHFDEPGTGRATRKDSTAAKTGSFEGAWVIKYFEPDGNLAVTAFDLALERKGQVRSRTSDLVKCLAMADIDFSFGMASGRPRMESRCSVASDLKIMVIST